MELWRPGLEIQGTYRIEKQFAGGGFGIVYKAQDLRRNRTVAIKTLNPVQIGSDRFEEEQDRFMNEGMKLAKCQHPHIVEVHELVRAKGLLGMVMEFVEGETLAECLAQRGKPFEESVALEYVRQVGEALQVLHRRSMLHRDVKPLNIMRRKDCPDEAVLIDFGLAREVAFDLTQLMSNSGTPHYAAPEQFGRDEQVKPGAHTDVYGLAATLYTLLTGEAPFPAEFQRQGVPLIEPRKHNPQISERVNGAIMKGMALEVSDRCGWVWSFLEALGIGEMGPAPLSPRILEPKEQRNSSLTNWPIEYDHNPFELGYLDENLVYTSPHRPNPAPYICSFETVRVDKQGKIIKRIPGTAECCDIDLGNGVELTLVRIPSGEFMMGSPNSEKGRDDEEGPQHRVTVQEFWLGKYPVTQSQWHQVASLPKQDLDLKPDPSHFEGGNRPVEQVSRQDVQEFCRRVSQQAGISGMDFGLPSEAQWEYACRAGSTSPFAFGPTITSNLANYDGNNSYSEGPKGRYRQGTTPVNEFFPNAWGLSDMHGNVWEWCADNWHSKYQGAPSDDRPWLSNKSKTLLVRGGAWCNPPESCRSACRSYLLFDLLGPGGGFRLALFRPRT